MSKVNTSIYRYTSHVFRKIVWIKRYGIRRRENQRNMAIKNVVQYFAINLAILSYLHTIYQTRARKAYTFFFMNAFTIYLTFTIINQPLRTLFTSSTQFNRFSFRSCPFGHCMAFVHTIKWNINRAKPALNMHTNFKFNAHCAQCILHLIWLNNEPTPTCPCNAWFVCVRVTFLSISIFHRLQLQTKSQVVSHIYSDEIFQFYFVFFSSYYYNLYLKSGFWWFHFMYLV